MSQRLGAPLKSTVVLLVAALLLAGSSPSYALPVTLTANDLINTSSWDSGLHWSDGLAPSALKDYLVESGRTLRTPNNATNPAAFAGNTLTVEGSLLLKHQGFTGGPIHLNGGSIVHGVDNRTFGLNGALSVDADSTINASGANPRTLEISAAISGSGGLNIPGGAGDDIIRLLGASNAYSGTWTLPSNSRLEANAVNTLGTGSVTLTGGTLYVNASQSLNTINFPSGTVLLRGDLATTGDVLDADASGSVFTVEGARSMSVGGTLAVGEFRIGRNGVNATADFTGAVTLGNGAGTIDIALASANNTSTQGHLDLTAATAVGIDVGSIRIGTISGGSGQTCWGALTLPDGVTNTLAATAIIVGDSPASGNTAQTSQLLLGSGTNNLTVSTLTIGGRKSKGEMTIASDGILDLGGASTDLLVGYNDADGTGTNSVGVVDLTGGTFNATLDQIVLGLHNSGSGSGKGTLTMDSGIVTANSIILGRASANGTSSAPQNTHGIFNLSGGELHAGSITRGHGASLAQLNFTGGVLDVDTFGTPALPFDLIQNGGTLAPGNTPDQTDIFGDYIQNGGILEIEINGTDPGDQNDDDIGYDFVSVAGSATLNGTLQLFFTDGFLPEPFATFDVLVATSISLGPNFNFEPVVNPADGIFPRFSIEDGGIFRITAATPEPSTMTLLALGGLALLRRRRRR